MKKTIYLLLLLLLFNCNNERVLQLPEIENAEVTEVLDVSPAYIFYDETQPDSTLFNRKNLIGTTNWAVNVDKRLTLRQAIPHIQYLLEKRKKKSMHKNENAKNYFTCNDTSINNLGFLEFTKVNYITDIENYRTKDNEPVDSNLKFVVIHFYDNGIFTLSESFDGRLTKNEVLKIDSSFNSDMFSEYRKSQNKINLSFEINMSFQKYISIKHNISKYLNEKSVINPDELIF